MLFTAMVLSGYGVGLFAPILVRLMRGAAGPALALLPIFLLFFFFQFLPDAARGAPWRFSVWWFEPLGIALTFTADGQSLFFGFVMCVLTALAAFAWRDEARQPGANPMALTGLLCLFASALGCVFSDSFLGISLFSGGLSLSAFLLLISERQNRVSLFGLPIWIGWVLADTALIVAGLILFHEFGWPDFSSIPKALPEAATGWVFQVCALLVLAALSLKLALFPFGFVRAKLGELSGIGPVSLHCIALVPAGVCLLIKFSALFGFLEVWRTGLQLIGVLGLCAATYSLLTTSRIGILAVNASLVMVSLCAVFVSLFSAHAAAAVGAIVLVHSTSLAALFLCCGHFVKKFSVRTIASLSGLRRLVPVAIGLWMVAVLSIVGLVPSLGLIALERGLALPVSDGSLVLMTGALLIAFVGLGVGLIRLPMTLLDGGGPQDHVLRRVEERGGVANWFVLCAAVLLIGVALVSGFYPAWVSTLLLDPMALSAASGPYVPLRWTRETLVGLAVPWSTILLAVVLTTWVGDALRVWLARYRVGSGLRWSRVLRFGVIDRTGLYPITIAAGPAIMFWVGFVLVSLSIWAWTIAIRNNAFDRFVEEMANWGIAFNASWIGVTVVGCGALLLATRMLKLAQSAIPIAISVGFAALLVTQAGAKTLGFTLFLIAGLQSIFLVLLGERLDQVIPAGRPLRRRVRDGFIGVMTFVAVLGLLVLMREPGPVIGAAGDGLIINDAIAFLSQQMGAWVGVILAATALIVWLLSNTPLANEDEAT